MLFALYMNFRDEKLLYAFGLHLKFLRKKLGYTQEELAYSSGISLFQIARIETGKINPTICTIIAIANFLNIHPKDMLDFFLMKEIYFIISFILVGTKIALGNFS